MDTWKILEVMLTSPRKWEAFSLRTNHCRAPRPRLAQLIVFWGSLDGSPDTGRRRCLSGIGQVLFTHLRPGPFAVVAALARGPGRAWSPRPATAPSAARTADDFTLPHWVFPPFLRAVEPPTSVQWFNNVINY